MKKYIAMGVTLLACMGMLYFATNSLHTSVVKSKYEGTNPHGETEVSLVKEERTRKGVRFHLGVDGQRVFSSSYFKNRQGDFSERLVWSVDGKRVAVEVGDTLLGGYDLHAKRDLTGDEVHSLNRSSFEQLRYSGRLPRKTIPVVSPRGSVVLPGALGVDATGDPFGVKPPTDPFRVKPPTDPFRVEAPEDGNGTDVPEE